MHLTLTPQLEDADAFYEELVAAQRDLSDDEAVKLLARLVLVLANHVAEPTVLREALRVAARRPIPLRA